MWKSLFGNITRKRKRNSSHNNSSGKTRKKPKKSGGLTLKHLENNIYELKKTGKSSINPWILAAKLDSNFNKNTRK